MQNDPVEWILYNLYGFNINEALICDVCTINLSKWINSETKDTC